MDNVLTVIGDPASSAVDAALARATGAANSTIERWPQSKSGGPDGPPLAPLRGPLAQLLSMRTATHWKSPWRNTRSVTTR